MSVYKLEEKAAFIVLGYGIDLKSYYIDYMGVAKEKADFWSDVKEDGTLDKLQTVADNGYVFAVNEAYHNKMMYYAGVLTDKTLPDATRIIEFSESMYVIVSGEADSREELENTLTGITFGQALMKVKDYHYVGGPNATVNMGQKEGKYFGEMWIPVVAK